MLVPAGHDLPVQPDWPGRPGTAGDDPEGSGKHLHALRQARDPPPHYLVSERHMLSLLETLITFIGVMLVLALAAQSIQEMVKVIFALKGQAALRGLRGLINEAVQSQGLIN